jgi:hypothetical protein
LNAVSTKTCVALIPGLGTFTAGRTWVYRS